MGMDKKDIEDALIQFLGASSAMPRADLMSVTGDERFSADLENRGLWNRTVADSNNCIFCRGALGQTSAIPLISIEISFGSNLDGIEIVHSEDCCGR